MARAFWLGLISAFIIGSVWVSALQTCKECSSPCESTTTVECMAGMCFVNTTGGETTRGCAEPCEETQSLTCCNDTDNCNEIPPAESAETTTSNPPTTAPTAAAPTTTPAPTTTTTKEETTTTTTPATTKAPTTTKSNETPTTKCHSCEGTGCGLSDMTAQEEISCKGKCYITEVETSEEGAKTTVVSRGCSTECLNSDTTTTTSGVTARTVNTCCHGEKCNGQVTGVASTEFQCYKCTGNSESSCATNLTDATTVGCKTQCYMRTYTSSGVTLYERGCALQCTAGSVDGDTYTCCSTDKCNSDLNKNTVVKCHSCSGSNCGLSDMTATATTSCSGRCHVSQISTTMLNVTTTLTYRGCLSVCTDTDISSSVDTVKTRTVRSCCDAAECNGKVTGVAETPFTCHQCTGNSDSSCATDLKDVSTVDCSTQCYTKTWELAGSLQYERGCKLQCTNGKDSTDNTYTCCNTDKCNAKMETPEGYTKCYKCSALGSSSDCPENTDDWAAISEDKKQSMVTSCKGKCFKSVTPLVKTVSRGCTPVCINSELGGLKMKCCDGDLCNAASRDLINMAAFLVPLLMAFNIVM